MDMKEVQLQSMASQWRAKVSYDFMVVLLLIILMGLCCLFKAGRFVVAF